MIHLLKHTEYLIRLSSEAEIGKIYGQERDRRIF